MYDPKTIGLCASSIMMQTDYRGLCEAASKAGFSSVSMLPSIFNMAQDSGLSDTDMRQILTDNGLHITELDPFCAWLPTRVPQSDLTAYFYNFSEDDFYKIADTLGAKSLNLIQPSTDFIEKSEVVEALIAVSERAAQRDLKVSIEFLPWSPINSLGATLELIEAANQPNLGVNIDTWHHFRTGGTIEQIRNIDPSKVTAMQFNDVEATPWDNIKDETSMARKMPGQGASNSVEVVKAFFDAGVDVPLNVEVFNCDTITMDADTVAQQMGDAMRAVLAAASK